MEKRIYDKSTLNPKGTPENLLLCIDEVDTGWHLNQCSRKRGHGIDGLYCKQHARKHERNLTYVTSGDSNEPLYDKGSTARKRLA